MKKIVKLICFVLFLAGCGALIGCYCTMPERTKYAMDIVVEYINKPLPIIGISILTLGLVAYEIISKTSYGKKTINEVKKYVEEQKQICLEYKEKGEEYFKTLETYKEEQKAVLIAYSTEIDLITEKVEKVCKTSPNLRINAIGEELKDDIASSKQKLEENLNKIDNDLGSYLEEHNKVEEIENKIAELEELLKGMVVQNEENNKTEEE